MLNNHASSTDGQPSSADGQFWMTPTSTPELLGHTVLTGSDTDHLYTFRVAPGSGFDPHQHVETQFVWPIAGSIQVSTPDTSTVLRPGRGAWVPSGMVHAVMSIGDATIRTLYLHELRSVPQLSGLTVVTVDELLGAVLDRLGTTDLSNPERVHLEAVLFDCIARHEPSTHGMPLPDDDRARRVAMTLLDEPADSRTLTELARSVGASSRTLRRIFHAQTGLSFEQWRRRARMHVASSMLASGSSVQRCARSVGYRSPSAFAAAYRDTFGHAPSEQATPHRP